MKAKTLIAELRKEFFILINESHYLFSKRRCWTHHDAGKCFDEAVKNVARRVKQGELKDNRSFEERALESFKALVNSEESERFMREYYSEPIQVKTSGHCSKCEPAPGKMIPVTPTLLDGTIRCMGCGRVMGEA